MPTELEFEGLKREIEKVADYIEDHLDSLDNDVDGECAVGILRSLLNGATAETIIEGYGLEAEETTGI